MQVETLKTGDNYIYLVIDGEAAEAHGPIVLHGFQNDTSRKHHQHDPYEVDEQHRAPRPRTVVGAGS